MRDTPIKRCRAIHFGFKGGIAKRDAPNYAMNLFRDSVTVAEAELVIRKSVLVVRDGSVPLKDFKTGERRLTGL